MIVKCLLLDRFRTIAKQITMCMLVGDMPSGWPDSCLSEIDRHEIVNMVSKRRKLFDKIEGLSTDGELQTI